MLTHSLHVDTKCERYGVFYNSCTVVNLGVVYTATENDTS